MNVLILVYIVIALLAAIFGAAAVFHTFKYSYEGDWAKLGAFVYVALFALIVIASIVLIGTTDFSGGA
jgi:hypothetical protein